MEKQSDIPNTHQNQCSFSMGNHMGVGQVKTNEKSNEITAAPEHLEHLDRKGVIVIKDALVDVRRK